MHGLLFSILRDTAAAGAAASLPDSEWQSLLAEAEAHAVQPLVAQRLMAAAPDARKPELRGILEASAMKGMLRHRDFAAVARALAADGIPLLALKGIHLATAVYRDVGVRPMHDLDLLVPAEQLGAAGAALECIGYVASRPYVASDGSIPYAAFHHLPPFTKDGATMVELHWHIIDSRDLRIDVDELWQRSQSIRIAGIEVRVLAPEDLLLHLAIHATYGHLCDHSARAWCDIAETVRQYSIAWPEVVDRATRWRCRRGTYLALRTSRDLVGAAVPDDVLGALRPDDFDDDLLRIAAREKPADEARWSTHWLHLRGEASFRDKLRTIRSRVFLPRDVLADHYAVPRTSPRVYGLYALRVLDLLRHRPAAVSKKRIADRVALQSFLRDERS